MKIVLEKILADQHSSDVVELIESLPSDNAAACKEFCKRFDYLADNPQWLYESLLQTNLLDLLGEIVDQKMLDEEVSHQQVRDMFADLRAF